MKSIHGKFATREDTEKFISVGKPAKQAVSYTKADFLTPGKVAEKFQISTEEAKKDVDEDDPLGIKKQTSYAPQVRIFLLINNTIYIKINNFFFLICYLYLIKIILLYSH